MARESATFIKARANNPHLARYCIQIKDQNAQFFETLTGSEAEFEQFSIIYPVGDPLFIHVLKPDEMSRPIYTVIEPDLTDIYEKYQEILYRLLEYASMEEEFHSEEEFDVLIKRLLEKVTTPSEEIIPFTRRTNGNAASFFARLRNHKGKIPLTPQEYEVILYRIKRDILQHGSLEGLIRDPYIEDIHAVGLKPTHIVHKVFGMLSTNVHFQEDLELDRFLRNISERIGHPVSDTRPIVDAALPDGSRINIVYSSDVSREGPSFTIRKFTEKPPPISQLIKWGTLNPQIAAYLWLCLENGMSIFISGETASGKTTTLNGMLSFVNFRSKIFSAEDTPEVVVPHPVWQRLITREAGAHESRVELFDLVRAALRSRPDYIIVGEIRGKEGSAAFQAIQTGHAVLTTFHASSISRMIQRFTGDPINVPIRFMDNLNIALFQELQYIKGRIARRCSSIQEIIRYSKEKDGVLTREIFNWDPVTDSHIFIGRFNSFILEEKIAAKLGLEDRKEIYLELDRRAKIIQRMVDENIVGYDEVNSIMKEYSEKGFEGFPNYLKI